MKLTELEPRLIVYKSKTVRSYIDLLVNAQGIIFLCPKCFQEKGNFIGVHSIECSFADRNVPPDWATHNKKGNPVYWSVQGNDIFDLTLQPSILLEDGCNWHGFISNGEVTNA